MKIFTLLILLTSQNVLANCKELTRNDGWGADGVPGIISLLFNEDKTVSIQFDGYLRNPKELVVFEKTASWSCSNAVVELKLDDQNFIKGKMSFLQNKNMWSIKFENSPIEYLSERELTPFSI